MKRYTKYTNNENREGSKSNQTKDKKSMSEESIIKELLWKKITGKRKKEDQINSELNR